MFEVEPTLQTTEVLRGGQLKITTGPIADGNSHFKMIPKICKCLFCRRYKVASAQPYSILQALDNAVDSVKGALLKADVE